MFFFKLNTFISTTPKNIHQHKPWKPDQFDHSLLHFYPQPSRTSSRVQWARTEEKFVDPGSDHARAASAAWGDTRQPLAHSAQSRQRTRDSRPRGAPGSRTNSSGQSSSGTCWTGCFPRHCGKNRPKSTAICAVNNLAQKVLNTHLYVSSQIHIDGEITG